MLLLWRLLDRGYPYLLGALLVATAVPLWVTEWLPLTAFGAWVEQLDVAWRHDDPTTSYADRFVWPDAGTPNSLSVWFAMLLGPLLGTLGVAKLWLSLAVVGLPLAAGAVARTFGRSRWLAFAFVPLAWGASMQQGRADFAMALPLALLAVALARRLADDPTPRRVVGLLLTFVALFYTHLLGFAAGWALSLLVLLTHVPLRRALIAAPIWVAPLPLVGLYAGRLLTSDGAGPWVYGDVAARLKGFPEASTGFFAASVDEWMFIVLLGGWFLLMLQPAEAAARAATDDAEPAVRRWAREFGAEILTFATLAAYLVLPERVGDIGTVGPRYAVVALIFLLMWPRVTFSRGFSRWLGLAVIAMVTAYVVILNIRMYYFGKRTTDRLEPLVEMLPDGARLGLSLKLTGAWPMGSSAIRMIPSGIHAVRNGGLTSQSPAALPTSPIRFRPGAEPPRFERNWIDSDSIYEVEHLLVDTPAAVKKLKGRRGVRLRGKEGPWHLFDVERPTTDLTYAVPPSLPGEIPGAVRSWACPRRHYLVGFSAAVDPVGVLRLQPFCRRVLRDKRSRTPLRGPVFGDRKVAFNARVTCPDDTVVIGLHGYRGLWVQGLGLRCGGIQEATTPPRVLDPEGLESGEAFDLRCAPGTRGRGLRVRTRGQLLSVGIACGR